MRAALFIAAFACGGLAFGQALPANLNLAVKESRVVGGEWFVPHTDFSQYSKKYDETFGRYVYTLNSQNFKLRNVYVDSNDRYFYNKTEPFIMNMQPPGVSPDRYYFYNNADYIRRPVFGAGVDPWRRPEKGLPDRTRTASTV